MGKIRKDIQETVEPYVEKLDDKIKKLNSTRVYKKITPKGDITWYVKWVSTILVCLLYTSPSPRDLSTSRMPSSA